MKLIEKKCPNCGANLEFDDDAKSCKCQYCKQSFFIEKDLNDVDKFNLIYDKINKPFKLIFLVPFVAFITILVIIIIGFNRTTKIDNNFNKDSDKELIENQKEKLISSVDDLSNSDFDTIDSHATSEINHSGEGVNNSYHSYSISGNIKREKLYVVYKDEQNYIIPVYKATYRDFFHQENQYTVYIPIVFENIKTNIIFSIGNPKLSAPEFYFNDEHTSYTYGYSSIDDVYNNLIKQYENEYKITEK